MAAEETTTKELRLDRLVERAQLPLALVKSAPPQGEPDTTSATGKGGHFRHTIILQVIGSGVHFQSTARFAHE